MLPVGIDPAAVRIAMIERPAVAWGDPDRQTAIGSQRKDLCSACERDLGSAIGRAVVHHEHVRVGQLAREVVEDGRKVLLFVPRRNEDNGVTHGCRCPRFSSSSAARSWRDRTVRAPSSQMTADGVGTTLGASKLVRIPCAAYSRLK